jgi:phosphoribosylformylglycinamidine (FGAM) synthase PurS component
MKVKELIAKLQQLDGELTVYRYGFNNVGYDDITDVKELKNIVLNYSNDGHVGSHELLEDVYEEREYNDNIQKFKKSMVDRGVSIH